MAGIGGWALEPCDVVNPKNKPTIWGWFIQHDRTIYMVILGMAKNIVITLYKSFIVGIIITDNGNAKLAPLLGS